ncbi:MAG: S41 family peptidase [Muribaculaceae bacterium]|nr:S41 family peptidase [Muribaculaceae bacterium]
MSMGYLKNILAIFSFGFLMSACHHIEEWNQDIEGNFNALWTVVDEHYCFFEEKGVDWNEVYTRYHARLADDMKALEFFNLCAQMLDELEDGHVNLSSSFKTSYYRKWWSDYPQNFDQRLIEQYYLRFDYSSVGGMDYAVLRDNVGYIRYPSFSYPVGESALDAILNQFALCKGVIIDIRDNGGGEMTNVETIVSRFISERILAGSICHKTGPGHNDFSEPYPYYFNPAETGRTKWIKPVVVLTNRSTFSAANNFVSVMQYLPNVKIVGATTGGGSGMPFSSEIPCGWGVRMSACPVFDAQGLPTENGVNPSPGCEVDLDPVLALAGVDTMLDFAVETILNGNF